MRFTALLHHLTADLLRESFYSLKKKAAPGVDGVTWYEYEAGLEERLIDLHSRVHRGAYRALPSRRVYIQKEDGRQRPLGVAALEDKIVQQAVVTILNQIYAVISENPLSCSSFSWVGSRWIHSNDLAAAILPSVWTRGMGGSAHNCSQLMRDDRVNSSPSRQLDCVTLSAG